MKDQRESTIKKILKYLFLLIPLLYISVDLYIYFSYRRLDIADALEKKINLYSSIPADSLPKNITDAYETVYPGSLTHKIYPDLLWYLVTPRHNNSYVQINLAYDLTFTSRLALISVANQLDNRLTNEQCIYAYLCRFDFSNSARGIQNAAKVYYHKDWRELNERECIELMVMTKNPAVFNKFRHPEKLNAEVNKVLKKSAHEDRQRCISNDTDTQIVLTLAPPTEIPVPPIPPLPKDRHGYILSTYDAKRLTENKWATFVWLSNYTKDTLFYFGRSCRWRDYYHIFDTENLWISKASCPTDSQVVLSLAPNESTYVTMELEVPDPGKIPSKGFSIGFDLVKAENREDRKNFDKANRSLLILRTKRLHLGE